jgi:phosphoribosylformylglycinamidine synthase I
MNPPKIAVLTGFGINCQAESKYVMERALYLEHAGGCVDYLHMNDLVSDPEVLEPYHMLFFPGGFLDGDDIAAAKAATVRLRSGNGGKVDAKLRKFVGDGKLVLGICNGNQLLVKYPLLPDPEDTRQTVTLTNNDSGRFEDRWVYLRSLSSTCIFTRGVEGLYLPVRHGEGKFVVDSDDTLRSLYENDQVVFMYADADGRPTQSYPENPNGSRDAIAGICNRRGTVLGMMPHPEAFNHFTNHPRWTRIRERLKREGKPMPEDGEGMEIAANAVRYIKQNLL